MQTKYNNFKQQLNGFLKAYLDDGSFDLLKERINLPDEETNPTSGKISEFYREQLHINTQDSKERVRIDRIITFSEKNLSPEKFCKFLNELGHICLSEGKLDLANEIFRKANKLSNNDQIKAESLLGIADVFSRRAKWLRSLETIKQARALFKSLSDNHGLAKCENFLGTLYGEKGDIIKAKKHLLTSLSLINSSEDPELTANIYANIGIVYNIQGSPADSINHLKKALALYNKLDNYKSAVEVSLNIGIVQYEAGHYKDAMVSLDSSIKFSKENGYYSTLCLAYLAKAQVLVILKDFFYAEKFTNQALELSHNLDDKLTLADLYKVKGIIERELGNYAISETYLLNSFRINQSLNNEMNIAETSFELGLLYDKIEDVKSKNSCLKKAEEYFKGIQANTKVETIEAMLAFN